jgi:hypothetical protein
MSPEESERATSERAAPIRLFEASADDPMAGWGNNPVQVFRTGRDLHWVKFTSETGFELPSSCPVLPCYAPNRNRNSFCVMR